MQENEPEHEHENAPADTQSNTVFAFDHSVFRIEGANFALHPADKSPCYFLRLGQNEASLPIARVAAEFGIQQGCHDAEMLNTAIRALRYVQRIYPGDSIPSELLDGTASWTIADHHFAIAKGRLTLALASLGEGRDVSGLGVEELSQIVEDPLTKRHMNEAVGRLVLELGLGADGRQTVLARLDRLSREAAYLEALRDHVGRIGKIGANIKLLISEYSREKSVQDNLDRIKALLANPVKEAAALGERLKTACPEIESAIKDTEAAVEQIRDARDHARTWMLKWEAILVEWPAEGRHRAQATDLAIRNLYSFLARNYRVEAVWRGPPKEGASKVSI